MTETARGTCANCTAELPYAAAFCSRCGSAISGQTPSEQGPYPGGPFFGAQQPGMSSPTQGSPFHQSWPSTGWFYQAASDPRTGGAYSHAPYPGLPHPSVPYSFPATKSAGVAALLCFLMPGAGHLYLNRIGTGIAIVAGHLVFGLILLVLFAPLAILVGIALASVCAVCCYNLAEQINAGKVPASSTW